MNTRPTCPMCKRKYYTGDHFCSEDGTKLVDSPVDTCVYCGTILIESAKFCAGCGRTRKKALMKIHNFIGQTKWCDICGVAAGMHPHNEALCVKG